VWYGVVRLTSLYFRVSIRGFKPSVMDEVELGLMIRRERIFMCCRVWMQVLGWCSSYMMACGVE
jgi:hypothetical protein